MANLLWMLSGGREGCLFDGKIAKVDLSVVCHDACNVEVRPGERVFLSVRDTRRPETEQFSALGSICSLRQAELDTTVLLSVWAARDDAPTAGDSAGRRALGELRIPLKLALHGTNALLQAWVTLDRPSLCDSLASVGSGDEVNAFNQRLQDAPQQLQQPRICMSVCRTADVASLKLLMEAQASRKDAERVQELQDQIQQQSRCIEEMRRRLANPSAASSPSEVLRTRSSPPGSPLTDTIELGPGIRAESQFGEVDRSCLGTSPVGLTTQTWLDPMADPLARTVKIEGESERLRIANDELQEKVLAARLSKERACQEANLQIDSRNQVIKQIRRERDDALHELQRLRTESDLLHQQGQELSSVLQEMREKKESLLRLVEDLHQTCVSAGLSSAGRRSIDGVCSAFRVA